MLAGINQLREKYAKIGCDIEIAPRYYNSVYLTNISIPLELRGRGIASEFMNEFIKWADSLNLIITLSPTDKFGSNLPRLEDFYKRFGFIENRLNHRESNYVGSMIRFPNNNM